MLPHFKFSWHFSDCSPKPDQTLFGSPNFSLSFSGFEKVFEQAQRQDLYAAILGSPIYNGKVDRKGVLDALLRCEDIQDFITQINGEFLLFLWNSKTETLSVITDRYSSYPFFWAANQEELCLSYNYLDIAQHCSTWDGFKLRPEKAYEFFVLQRLMGEETHDTLTRSIPPATILNYQKKSGSDFKTYWKPNYQKDHTTSERALVNEFSRLFGASVNARLGEASESTGIFLSGGHDSRIVAAYAGQKTTCYTLSFGNNLEVSVAKNIADICGHDHVFSQIDQGFFEDQLETSTQLSSGLYTTDHALFLNDGMSPVPNEDIFLHGHGLDFMYQGMYLHAQYYQLFGRNTYVKHFLPVPDNMSGHFIDAIPFRLKYDLSQQLIPADRRKDMDEALHSSVSEIYDRACDLSDEPMDRLEYMIFHNPSRHYTFSNVLSKRTCGELRTPSFDNELYDFYLRLPFKYRLHASMMRGAMHKRNPKIANLPAANHCLPAGWGPYSKTAMLMTRKLLRHATFNQFFHGASGKDRTWPDRDTYFKDHRSYFDKALSPLADEEFKDFLSFIDWDNLEKNKEDLYAQHLYGAFLVTLLSYYRFYRAVKV